MKKIKISLCDVNLELHTRDAKMESFFKDFLLPSDASISISICPTEQDILSERISGMESPFELESCALLRAITRELLKHHVLLIHGVGFSYMGKGYLLTAPSGTGKSTHYRFLQTRFPDEITIINGDKTFLKFEGDSIVIYPSPFAGKERLYSRTKAKLQAIIQIKRGEGNRSTKLSSDLAFSHLAKQIYLFSDMKEKTKALAYLISLQKHCPVFVSEVSNSIESTRATEPILKGELT